MDERDFFNETETTKPANLHCTHCRQSDTYDVRWLLREKKNSLPRGADERDRAKFAKLRSYMIRRDDLVLCGSAGEALEGADALVVITEWKQFRSPDFARLKAALADGVVFDGRNLYEPDEVEAAGLAYYGIGRGRSLRRD